MSLTDGLASTVSRASGSLKSALTAMHPDTPRAASSQRSSTTRSEAREKRRRQRTKARANKMFDKQVSRTAPSGTDEGPRAALYKAKMGSKQRKSARMQRASEAEPVMAKVNPTGWFSTLGANLTPAKARIATAVLCVVLACAFLYTPVQQYYHSVREHARLEAEYAAIEARNEALDYQNDSLASNAGMEDAVRQKFGYVTEGEQTAMVSGLSEAALNRAGNENIEANVLSSTVKAPEEWYTPILDAIFGAE